MKDKEQKEIIAFDYPNLMKSNLLIGAKYKASLMELRVTYAALFMLQNNKYKEEPDGFYVSMYPAELKKFLGLEGHSIYDTLDPVAKSMTNRSIGFSDPVTKTFDYINLISRAKYENGVFTVKFNKDMQDYIIDLKSNFTNLNRLTMMSFSSAYSFRLYELLKQQCFYPNSYQGERNNIFSYNVGLSELKFNLGVINAELDEVRKILSNGNKPDYERAEEKSPEKITSYGNWSNFRAKCLDVAVTEINTLKECDIYVEYNPIRVGRGGKVKGIDFTIYLNGAEKRTEDRTNTTAVDKRASNGTGSQESTKDVSLEDTENDVILDETTKFMIKAEVFQELSKNHTVKIEEIDSLCNEAHYNKEKILHAIHLLDSQSGEIHNMIGWLITAIREGYTKGIPEEEPNGKLSYDTRANEASTFNQRSYDFDAMEKKVIKPE